MHGSRQLLLLGVLLLSACVAPFASPTALPQTPAAPSSPEACGYQWGNQELPELSDKFQASIQELQPEAQASAFAFGENCVRADGSVASFSAMETDFSIVLKVEDLTDETDLGEWIVKVMQVVEALPAEEIVGPRPGRVSMTFHSEQEQSVIHFYTDQYARLPSGLSSLEIFQSLQPPQ
jgi:hypothetical protein